MRRRKKIRDKRAFHLKVLKADGYVCQGCNGAAIEGHHIISKSLGGSDDLSNGISFCRACHGKAEEGHRTATGRETATEYVIRIIEQRGTGRWSQALERLKLRRDRK